MPITQIYHSREWTKRGEGGSIEREREESERQRRRKCARERERRCRLKTYEVSRQPLPSQKS